MGNRPPNKRGLMFDTGRTELNAHTAHTHNLQKRERICTVFFFSFAFLCGSFFRARFVRCSRRSIQWWRSGRTGRHCKNGQRVAKRINQSQTDIAMEYITFQTGLYMAITSYYLRITMKLNNSIGQSTPTFRSATAFGRFGGYGSRQYSNTLFDLFIIVICDRSNGSNSCSVHTGKFSCFNPACLCGGFGHGPIYPTGDEWMRIRGGSLFCIYKMKERLLLRILVAAVSLG